MFGLILVFIALFITGCSQGIRIQHNPPIYALNTTIDVTFYNVENGEEHYKNIKKIYQDIDKVSSDFSSNYDETSVYDLNNKRSIIASDILINLVKEALYYMEKTNGYYNPFIGRISHIWKNVINTGVLPSEAKILEELNIMNNTSIIIDGNTLTLVGDGNLDLGGIAKGYASELAYQYFKENEINGYLIDAGNSSILAGNKAGKAFRLGLINPNNNKYYATVRLIDKNIATSSPHHQKRMIDGKIYHHLINPKTGYPSNLYSALSIVGDNNTALDVLSTAMFSMELDDIKYYENKFAVKAIVLKDNDIYYKNEGCDFYAQA